MPDIDSSRCEWWGSAQSSASGKGRVSSVNRMSSSLVVARTAPASEDGVQLGGVKRPCVLTVREPAEASGAVEEPGRRQAATRLADGERGDERAVRPRILLHQALQGFGHLMDRMGWQDIESLRHLLVGKEDSALRGALEESAYPCMRRQPIVLSQSWASSAATIARRRTRWRRYNPVSR